MRLARPENSMAVRLEQRSASSPAPLAAMHRGRPEREAARLGLRRSRRMSQEVGKQARSKKRLRTARTKDLAHYFSRYLGQVELAPDRVGRSWRTGPSTAAPASTQYGTHR